jgi:hypothetical protein
MNAICKIDEFNELIVNLLQEMDQETGPYLGSDAAQYPNYPVGLWWYAEYRWPGKTHLRSEVAWSERIAEILKSRGYQAINERYFPNSRQRCDVVVDIGWKKPIWLEIKGAWREKFDPPAPNSAYAKHLLAAAEDLEKLSSLDTTNASGLSFVLVGFDQPESRKPISDSDLAPIRMKARLDGWTELYRNWMVEMSIRFRTQIWIWTRRLDAIGS